MAIFKVHHRRGFHWQKLMRYPAKALFLLLCLFMIADHGDLCEAKQKTGWKKVGGEYVYYNAAGKRLKGLQTIDGKVYFFNRKGEQGTGWRYVNGEYYFFQQKTKANGYMLKGTKVNQIKLKRSGKAKVTETNRAKLGLMVQCQAYADSLTKASQSRERKLRIMFQTLMAYPYRNQGDFLADGRWDIYYANFMLDRRYGDCFGYACLYGYLMNAVGCRGITFVSSEGHGWVEMDGHVYDPQYARVIGMDKCFHTPLSLSGVGERINYRKYGFFRQDLDG